MLTRWREGVRHPLPKPPTAEQPPYLVGEYDPAAAPLLPCKPPETPAAAEPVKHIEFACMRVPYTESELAKLLDD